jgi:hypothetical protein
MTLTKREYPEVEAGSTRSHSVKNTLWERLRTFRKTDYVMMWINIITVNLYVFSTEIISVPTTCLLKKAAINRYACLHSPKKCTSFTTCSFVYDLPHTKFHIPCFSSFLVIVTNPHVKEQLSHLRHVSITHSTKVTLLKETASVV